MLFNEPGANVIPFGPAPWIGDVLVCGYSRGKLYRTALHKTERGYIAQNQLIASVNGLLVDGCLSSTGEMLVATHSGAPDWGSGPQGNGTLYKLRYVDKQVPQPVRIWSQGPYEVRIAFDRPLKLAGREAVVTKGAADCSFRRRSQDKARTALSATVEFGPAVGAGDRYEALRPGYQVVQDQLDSPRMDLPVHSVQLMPDGRTLTLTTGEMTRALPYAITLSGLLEKPAKPLEGDLPQDASIDLQYDLAGVQTRWQSADGARLVGLAAAFRFGNRQVARHSRG